MSSHDRCGEDVAPYLLGALDRPEAERFERHLRGCERCRTDLARLRPVVDALPTSPEAVDPPPELRRRIMAEVRRDAAARRVADRPPRPAWLRPLPALAAACVILLAGVVAGVVLSDRGTARTVEAQVAVPGASAALEIDDGDGTLRVEGLPSPPRDRVWQVWLVHRSGGAPRPTDALFTTDRAGHARVGVPGDLDRVSRVLVSEEPRGGSRSPTTAPRIDVRL